ncbi:MAG: DNA mismatch repair protein MutS, partial [Dehalococcoidia bacterium]
PGGADRSYGIHVAQLAGLPRPVIQRAHELLEELEAGRPAGHGDRQPPRAGGAPRRRRRELQLPLFPPQSELAQELASLDVDSLTPLQALTKLYELQERARGQARP